MKFRTVSALAVLVIVGASCGENGGGTEPRMCSYSGLTHLEASDPRCVPAPPPTPAPTVDLSLPTNGMQGDTVSVLIVASNAVTCTPNVLSGAVLIDSNNCISFRIMLGNPGIAVVSAVATGSGGSTTAPSKQIDIKPRPAVQDTVTVRVYSPYDTDSPAAGMSALFVWWNSGTKDSSAVALAGNSATAIIPAGRDSIEIRFPNTDPRYSTDRKIVAYRGDYYHKEVKIILEPTSHVSRAQQFAGQIHPFSMKDCLTQAGPTDGSSFCEISIVPKNTGGTQKVLSRWESSASIKVGIVVSKSKDYDPISDPAHITSVISELNPYLAEAGTTRFEYAGITGDTVPDGMIGIIIGDNPWSAPGGAGTSRKVSTITYEISKSTITFPSRLYMQIDQVSVIMHELIHTQGINHTCEWNTIMTSPSERVAGGRCDGKRSSRPVQKDNVMYEAPLAISSAAKKHGTPFAFN